MNHNISNVGVTLHFSTGLDLLKKYWKKINIDIIQKSFFHRAKSIEKIPKKDKHWHNQLRKAFSTGQNLVKKNIEKRKILAKTIEKKYWEWYLIAIN